MIGKTRNYNVRDRLPFGPMTKTADKVVRETNQADKRASKSISYNAEWTPDGTREKYRWVEYPEDGLRFVGKVHEIGAKGYRRHDPDLRQMINHTGWFINSFQEETVCGLVYQLPARNGESVYVPAVSDYCGSDGAILDFHSTTSDLADAIRRADGMAEAYAEREREYQAKEDTKIRIEEIEEEIKTERSDLLTLVRELRANCAKFAGMSAVRSAIREHIKRVRRTCEKLTREKARIEERGLEY